MKIRALLALATVLASAALLAPAAAAQDLCSVNPTVKNDVCCAAPSNPTTTFYCTVRGAAIDYVGPWVDYTVGLATCMVFEQPIAKWVSECVRLTTG